MRRTKKKKRGKFIVFEGIDGSGKSVQEERIFRYLDTPQKKRRFGYTGVHLTKEPTGHLIGGLIQSQLRGDWHSSQECLQLLFAADRAYHLEKEVEPLLEKGICVVSDRYFFSSVAYGGLDLDKEWLMDINRKFLHPDITFFLDVSAKTGIQRIRRDRHEVTLFEKEQALKKVRNNFKLLARQSGHIYILNGERPIDTVTNEVISILEKKL